METVKELFENTVSTYREWSGRVLEKVEPVAYNHRCWNVFWTKGEERGVVTYTLG